MRAGVALAHASGKKQVTNCTTIGCEQGYELGNGVATSCKSDLAHGCAFKSTYDRDKWNLDIEIIPAVDPYYNGQKCIAFIGMDDSEITIKGEAPNLPADYRIQVGGTLDGIRFKEANLDYQSTHNALNNTINNQTVFPIEIAVGSSGNKITTLGSVKSEATDNHINKASR